jgi:tRNA U34 2-thiouridine synthase MnmA/TrmU
VSFVTEPPGPHDDVLVQHRAHGDVTPARLDASRGGFEVTFSGPVEAVAPGQSAAFYRRSDPDEVLGGGIIARTTPVDAAA